MSRISAFCLIVALAGAGFTACNSSHDDFYDTELPSSAIVKSFYISENDKVLDNLDKVFFSIDLANLRIFNADSMPYGTDVHALVPKITTGGVSKLELIVPRPGKADTTYNYVENPEDSIDFSNGPVKLKLTSINELVSVTYTVNVNVHKVKSDSLSWGNVAYMALPTKLTKVTEQQTVKHNGKAYCLTSDGDKYCMAISENPGSKEWVSTIINPGFAMRVETLRSAGDGLYVIDGSRRLFKSTDEGLSWTDMQMEMDYLIGGYENEIIGTVTDKGKWQIVTSTGKKMDAPEGFPVSGSSVPVEYSFPMSSAHQLTIVGGRTGGGSLTNASWGYDGTQWACLSNVALPEALEGVAVFPYFIFEVNNYWVANENSIFVAIGGKNKAGVCNRTVYISYNYGMSWKKAPVLMQLPQEMRPSAYAQAVVFPTEMNVKPSASAARKAWKDIALRPLPPFWSIAPGKIYSRASTAITSWECPYVYVFGGIDEYDDLYNTVWRGVVNRLTFKPIQ